MSYIGFSKSRGYKKIRGHRTLFLRSYNSKIRKSMRIEGKQRLGMNIKKKLPMIIIILREAVSGKISFLVLKLHS